MNDSAIKPVRVVIFAKAPKAGFAKTRLIPALGAEGAARLAKRMLFKTLNEALIADIGPVELCVTPDIDQPVWQTIALTDGIEIAAQGDGDLGARLSRAAERALSSAMPVLLIGTDCVEMSAALLREAANTLQRYDAIIHCTLDGGYALLGLKKFSPILFHDIPWSTDAVARSTLSRIGRLGWTVHVGRLLHDVDEPQDLKYLAKTMQVAMTPILHAG